MTHPLVDLRNFMEIARSAQPQYQQDTMELPYDVEVIEVQPDSDALLDSLELMRFKLINHRQLVGSNEFAAGYEEACMRVVEMIDGIIRTHGSTI